MRDLHNNIKIVKAISSRTITGSSDVNGADVDLQGYESLEHIVIVGNASGSDTLSGSLKLDLILQEADADSTGGAAGTYSNVTDSDLVIGGSVDSNGIFATIDSNTEDDNVFSIGYIGAKRFSRVRVDVTGSHTATPISAIAVLGNSSLKPVA